jgi:hypothetical protein
VLLHELGHVDAHHGLLGVEQELGQGLAQLGLADTGRPEEQERAVRAVGIRQPGARAADGVGHGSTASSWPTTRSCSASSMRSSFSRSPSSIFETGMPVQRETTSAISSSVTLLRSRCVSPLSARLRHAQLLLQFRDAAVLQLGHARQVAGTARRLDLQRACSISLLDVRPPCRAAFSDFQISSRSANSRSSSSICSQSSSNAFRGLVGLLLQRLALDLELDQATFERPSPRAWSRSPCGCGSPPRRSGRWPCPAAGGR